MPGHSYAVRKVICSPHSGNLVASCSYDMTVCLWDIKSGGEPLIQVRSEQNSMTTLAVLIPLFAPPKIEYLVGFSARDVR